MTAPLATHSSVSEIEDHIESLVTKTFPVHPFEEQLDRDRITPLLRRYLAMSAAFPYLQSGAAQRIALRRIEDGEDFSTADEIPFAVGAFLSWDETGGNQQLQEHGMPGLPGVLETRKHFHSALLRQDIRQILGEDVSAKFDEATRRYLVQLSEGLSSLDPVIRVAYMASFEAHAERMINGLWARLVEIFDISKDDLAYFRAHVGGDDPAEAYHVATTAGMIQGIVPDERRDDFFNHLISAYGEHVEWCRQIRN